MRRSSHETHDDLLPESESGLYATPRSCDRTWRRIYLIQFDVTIPENERDPHLLEKLRGEASGILAWAVQGCLEWQANGAGAEGLRPPERIRNATRS